MIDIDDIKRRVDRAKGYSVDDLLYRLEVHCTGATIHTASKARTILLLLSTSDSHRYEFGEKYDMLADLKVSVVDALEDGNWVSLREHLRHWL